MGGVGNEIEGEGEYFREILAFLVFPGLLEISPKVTVCPATRFAAPWVRPRPGSPARRAVITQAAPSDCDGPLLDK